MAKLFLSHTSADKPFVKRVAEDLHARGHICWLDEWNIKVGRSILQSIETGIEDSDYVLLFLSKKSAESKWVDREWRSKFWDQISKGGTFVLPCLIEECAIPQLLKDIKYANFSEHYDVGLEELFDGMNPVDDGHPALSIQTIPNASEIATLISKVHARTDRLSACIAEGLGLALKLKNKLLEQFCREELSGIKPTRNGLYQEPDVHLRPYRLVEAFASKVGSLNPGFVGFNTESGVFHYITTHPDDFTSMKLSWGHSIAEIESAADRKTPNATAMSVTKKYGDLMPGKSNADVDIPLYMRPSVHDQLLDAIRREFVNRLLDCLPEAEGTAQAQEEMTSPVTPKLSQP